MYNFLIAVTAEFENLCADRKRKRRTRCWLAGSVSIKFAVRFSIFSIVVKPPTTDVVVISMYGQTVFHPHLVNNELTRNHELGIQSINS